MGRVIGQFLEGLAYASNKLTDGFLAVSAVKRFKVGPKPLQVAEVMVGVGLWHAVEGGYRIHDYHEFNLSAEEAITVREKRAAAGRRGGLKSGQQRRNKPEANTKQRASQVLGAGLKQTGSKREPQSQSQSPGSQIRTGGVISRTEDGPNTESPPALWRQLWERRWPEGICRTSHAELTELERLVVQLGAADVTARIGRYLATDRDRLVQDMHPLHWFLQDVNRYRTPSAATRKSPRRAAMEQAAAAVIAAANRGEIKAIP